MSWSGTVTCSHCYQRGHNKRKCPKLTEEILDRYGSYKRSMDRMLLPANYQAAS